MANKVELLTYKFLLEGQPLAVFIACTLILRDTAEAYKRNSAPSKCEYYEKGPTSMMVGGSRRT